MRAAVFYGPNDLRIEEVPDPQAGPGEIVMHIDAALTCGTDRKTYLRGHPRYLLEPGVLGHEFAGTIVEVGAGVKGVEVGERVVAADSVPCGHCWACRRDRRSLCEDLTMCFGGFAEAVAIPARIVSGNLYRLAERVDIDVAPLYEPLACAVKAVRDLELPSGSQVLVVGAGALGLLLTVALCRAGAVVTLADPHPERLALGDAFGAERTVRVAKDDSDRHRLRAAWGGRGPDVVVEAVGQVDAWRMAIAVAAPGGTVCFFGGCAPGTTVEVDAHRLHYEELRLTGSFHHDPQAVAGAVGLLEDPTVPWQALIQATVGLDQLEAVLAGQLYPAALKVAVVP